MVPMLFPGVVPDTITYLSLNVSGQRHAQKASS